MLSFFHENILLLSGTILAIFSLTFHMVNRNMIASIGDNYLPINLHYIAARPLNAFKVASHENKLYFMFLSFIALCIFCIFSFIFLSSMFTNFLVLILFIPFSFILMHIFYYSLWFGSIAICKIINVGNARFNVIFSLTAMELLLTYLGLPKNNLFTGSFYLALFNLFLCYFFTGVTLKMTLSEILSNTLTFNHQNLWKVAIMIIFDFLATLTLFCYIGYLYYPDAYNHVSLSLFDFFYYVIITFGTIGYGDIIPTCTYSKAIAILIVITSITCISIMLSSFLSVSSATNKK